MPNVGPLEFVLLAFAVLLLFGAKRLPAIGRSLGATMREFKEAVTHSSPDDEPTVATLSERTEAQASGEADGTGPAHQATRVAAPTTARRDADKEAMAAKMML